MSKFHVYRSILIAQQSFTVEFTSVTWPSPMLLKLNGTDDNPLGRIITLEENSLLASINIFGACLGSILYGILGNYFGRKTLLIVMSFPTLVAYLVLAWAKHIWIFFACRFVGGTGLGGAYVLLPVYCGEIADVNNRGILGTSMSVFLGVGMLIPYAIGPNLPFFWVHIILAMIPAIYIPSFILFSPESPHYLIKKDVRKAESVLKKLRGKDDVSEILQEMQHDSGDSPSCTTLNVMKSKRARKSFYIGLGLFTFMQLTGISIVLSYNQRIFEAAKGRVPPKIGPVIVSLGQLTTTIIVSSIADRYPRKLLLTISFLGVALILIPFGTYFYLESRGQNVSSISWIPLICLIVFTSMYSAGVGPITVVILGELFPTKVKGIEISILVSYNWGLVFILTYSFNRLEYILGIGGFFWILSACCFTAVVFVKFFVIETKGRTFHEIQDELNS